MDYLVPTRGRCRRSPWATWRARRRATRSASRACGEGGAISPPAAIANAVEDALRPFGVEVTATPLTPERVRALIDAATAGRDWGRPLVRQR